MYPRDGKVFLNLPRMENDVSRIYIYIVSFNFDGVEYL